MEAVPVIASGLFAGAALSISIGEQPARELIDPQHAQKHFQNSYKKIAVSQVCADCCETCLTEFQNISVMQESFNMFALLVTLARQEG